MISKSVIAVMKKCAEVFFLGFGVFVNNYMYICDVKNCNRMKVEQKKAVNPPKKFKRKDLKVFINLLTDFGFKRVFGIKEVMLDFLNVVFLNQDRKSF